MDWESSVGHRTGFSLRFRARLPRNAADATVRNGPPPVKRARLESLHKIARPELGTLRYAVAFGILRDCVLLHLSLRRNGAIWWCEYDDTLLADRTTRSRDRYRLAKREKRVPRRIRSWKVPDAPATALYRGTCRSLKKTMGDNQDSEQANG